MPWPGPVVLGPGLHHNHLEGLFKQLAGPTREPLIQQAWGGVWERARQVPRRC